MKHTWLSRALLLLVVAVAMALVAPLHSAAGGGSWLHPDLDHYRPGQTVHLSGVVFDLGNGVAPGPYYAHLVPSTGYDGDPRGPFPQRFGPLSVRRLPKGDLAPRLQVDLWFTLPRIGDGQYHVNVCSATCSAGLGDLAGGSVYVSPTPPPTEPWPSLPPPSEVVSATSSVVPTMRELSATDRSTGPALAATEGHGSVSTSINRVALVAVAGGATTIIVAALLIARRRQRHPAATDRAAAGAPDPVDEDHDERSTDDTGVLLGSR